MANFEEADGAYYILRHSYEQLNERKKGHRPPRMVLLHIFLISTYCVVGFAWLSYIAQSKPFQREIFVVQNTFRKPFPTSRANDLSAYCLKLQHSMSPDIKLSQSIVASYYHQNSQEILEPKLIQRGMI